MKRVHRWIIAGVVCLGSLPALGQASAGGSRQNSSRAVAPPLERTEQTSDDPIAKGQAPPNIRDFFLQELGRGEDEPIELSEISDVLDAFERKNKILIPDRDVLESSVMTTKDLMEAIQRRVYQNTVGADGSKSAKTKIEGNKSLAALRPFQRRDLLNNPAKLLKTVMGPLTDGQVDFYDSGATRRSGWASRTAMSDKDVVARAILSVRHDLADPRKNSPLAKYRTTRDKITDADYAELIREFMKNPTQEEYEALDVAVQRVARAEQSDSYSNGRPRFDARGQEVYANGQRKYDDRGRMLYPNGRPKFSSSGAELHSNGLPKYSSDGKNLYANGQAKVSDRGRKLYPDGSSKTNDRGIGLFDGGAKMVDTQKGIALDSNGQLTKRPSDGVQLYENARVTKNAQGEPLYPEGTKKVAENGERLFENGRRVDSARGLALNPDGRVIAGTEGYQGRANGKLPLFRVAEARVFEPEASRVKLQWMADEKARAYSLADVAVQYQEGGTLSPADSSKLPPGSVVRVLLVETWNFVDGEGLGVVGDPVLLAIFTSDPAARIAKPDGKRTMIAVETGRAMSVSPSTVLFASEDRRLKPRELSLQGAIAQRTLNRALVPIAPASVSRGQTILLVVRQPVEFAEGKEISAGGEELLALWQDPPVETR